jgi:ketosteroid isomerase-like protein
MTAAGTNPRALLDRLVPAVNDHDVEGLVACFHEDYVNENPAHPQRGFRGNQQVRRNWTQIFGEVPDVRARVLRSAVDGDSLWTEWEMSGTRRDGGDFDMRGVFIFGVADGRARWARMFLEPVEQTSGDADAMVRRVTGGRSTEPSGSRS